MIVARNVLQRTKYKGCPLTKKAFENQIRVANNNHNHQGTQRKINILRHTIHIT